MREQASLNRREARQSEYFLRHGVFRVRAVLSSQSVKTQERPTKVPPKEAPFKLVDL